MSSSSRRTSRLFSGLSVLAIGASLALPPSTGAAQPNPAPYDPFPEPGNYVTGTASAYPWVGESFQGYSNGQTVECSSNKAAQPHLDATSGCITARYFDQGMRGWIDRYNFRALAVGLHGGARVKWTDQVAEYRAYLDSWLSKADGTRPDWSGLHIFARYQDEDHLYVAAFRHDGKVTIKKKNGYESYVDLAVGRYLPVGQTPALGQWYALKFAAVGDRLDFYIDDQLVLTAHDDDPVAYGDPFTWGTTGIRIDYVTAYLDDWSVH